MRTANWKTFGKYSFWCVDLQQVPFYLEQKQFWSMYLTMTSVMENFNASSDAGLFNILWTFPLPLSSSSSTMRPGLRSYAPSTLSSTGRHRVTYGKSFCWMMPALEVRIKRRLESVVSKNGECGFLQKSCWVLLTTSWTSTGPRGWSEWFGRRSVRDWFVRVLRARRRQLGMLWSFSTATAKPPRAGWSPCWLESRRTARQCCVLPLGQYPTR